MIYAAISVLGLAGIVAYRAFNRKRRCVWHGKELHPEYGCPQCGNGMLLRRFRKK